MSEELIAMAMEVLLALLEGQSRSSVVFERIASTVEMGVLNALLMTPEAHAAAEVEDLDGVGVGGGGGGGGSRAGKTAKGYFKDIGSLLDRFEDLLSVRVDKAQAKYLAFIEIIGDVKDNRLAMDYSHGDRAIACVEVVFGENIEKVYFKIPVRKTFTTRCVIFILCCG